MDDHIKAKTKSLSLSRRQFLSKSSITTVGGAMAITSSSSATGSAAGTASQSITQMSAFDLSAAIKSKQVSCVEVMQAYLGHISHQNKHVNAIVSIQDEGELLAQAASRDTDLANGKYHGWMHGIPHAIKDLADSEGLVTSAGSPIFKSTVATGDDIHVARIKRAGAIIIGKTNVPEFGLGSQTYNPVFGATGNAWDYSKTAGGSSGGAACGLAMQMLPVADGSDFMGSLRNPAAFNNVIGFRPSPGLVPLGDSFIEELPCNGPMGRNVTDTAMLLSTMAGYDDASPSSLVSDPAKFTAPLSQAWKGSKVGWLGDFDGYLPMEQGVMSLCETALQGFRDIDCTVDEAKPDYVMEDLWQTWLVLRHWLSRKSAGPLYANPDHRKLLKPEAIWEVEGGAALTADDVTRASNMRGAWYHALRKLFTQFDFLVLPTAQVFPFDHTIHWPKSIENKNMDTYHRWMEVVIPGTLSGCPVINVPAGFNAQGLPMGLQIICKRYADLDALKIAYAYEQATRWNLDKLPPGLAS